MNDFHLPAALKCAAATLLSSAQPRSQSRSDFKDVDIFIIYYIQTVEKK